MEGRRGGGRQGISFTTLLLTDCGRYPSYYHAVTVMILWLISSVSIIDSIFHESEVDIYIFNCFSANKKKLIGFYKGSAMV